MYEDHFTDEVLITIEDRSEEAIILHRSDERYNNCFVTAMGVETDGLDGDPTASSVMKLEDSGEIVGILDVHLYFERDMYTVYANARDLLNKRSLCAAIADEATKEKLPEVIGNIVYKFVDSVLGNKNSFN